MKKRKDSGFTLIELMIVIAVIGILAIVLVPRVGTIKTQSKEAGLDTNIRVVQGYCESKINKWVSATPPVAIATIRADIVAAFSDNKALTNPITAVSGNAALGDGVTGEGGTPAANQPVFVLTTDSITGITGSHANPDTTRGTIVVALTDGADTTLDSITIYAHGDQGEVLAEKTVNIFP